MRCRAHESSPARKGRRGARLRRAAHLVGAVDLNTLNEVAALRVGHGEEGAVGVTDDESALEAPVTIRPRQRRRPSQLHSLCWASAPDRTLGSRSESMRRSGERTVRDYMSPDARRQHLLPIPPVRVAGSVGHSPPGFMSRSDEGVGQGGSDQRHQMTGAHVPSRSRGTSGSRTRIAASGSVTEIASLLNGAHRRSSRHSTGPPARTNAKSCPS